MMGAGEDEGVLCGTGGGVLWGAEAGELDVRLGGLGKRGRTGVGRRERTVGDMRWRLYVCAT